METSVPVLPVVHPAASSYPTIVSAGGCGGYSGFGCGYGFDSFVSQLHDLNAQSVFGLHDQLAHRDNLREVTQNRFDSEKGFRRLEVNQEKLERENQRVIVDRIRDDGDKTRDLLRDQERDRLRDELAALKAQLLVANGPGNSAK